MKLRHTVVLALISMAVYGCATSSQKGTLAELERVEADVVEVYLDDSLKRAARSYRRYLDETAESARTPEAMRRLADLQLEQEYGVIGGGGQLVEMATPESAARTAVDSVQTTEAIDSVPPDHESAKEFEHRVTSREALLSDTAGLDLQLPDTADGAIPAGPREAIRTYRQILETYPAYERNDQVLYQLARAYDEIGEPEEAMSVMDRLVASYPNSKFADEVYFRRGEYYFVRKKYLEAEEAYGSIIEMGNTSSYFELALYKLGWALYKQEFYEEALHNYVAMLDHRQSIGFEFDQDHEQQEEHRIADTFRVISLSFSNLGGPEVIDEYFTEHGHRQYADKIYGNLGEFYFRKLRYDDAASVYKSFIELKPFHKVSPYFSMRVVEIYSEAGFPKLVVESKKDFANTYALDAEYWSHFDVDNSPEVVEFLKTNLTDLAGHYHSLYQDQELLDDQPANLNAAQHWYRQFLHSFPTDDESPQINYQLADLLLENEDFGEAAREYERTAYEYPAHEQDAAAGYAAIFSHRKDLARAPEESRPDVMRATVDSSLKFVDTFPQHEQAPGVLGAAADDLYEMADFHVAIDSAQKLVSRYPDADETLRRSAWAVIAHSSIDLAEYENAEHAYQNVLALTPDDDETRPAVIDGLAAAIYKQGEAANQLEDYRTASEHFLRIKSVAPSSSIRSAAEYDAAAALMKLQDWLRASEVLEEFRTNNPDHELQPEATKQLAFVYLEDGQIDRSAAEHERIAAESDDTELSREALLTAGELYDDAGSTADAVRIFQRYVTEYPRPLDLAMETRSRLADIFKDESDAGAYHAQLREIVAVDRDAGNERTDRSKYLAAKAALVLAELSYEHFAGLDIVRPIEETLAEKQLRMDAAMAEFERLVDYSVANVTAAATYYIAEIYLNFSNALMNSERPADLTRAELVEYELALEDEAYPFEERAIDVHEANFGLLAAGVYNNWVKSSLDRLSVLMPARYAKSEISTGFTRSIDRYAYRMPIAPQIDPLGTPGVESKIEPEQGIDEPGETVLTDLGEPAEQEEAPADEIPTLRASEGVPD